MVTLMAVLAAGCCVPLVALLAFSGAVWAQGVANSLSSRDTSSLASSEILPAPKTIASPKDFEPQGVKWKSLFNQSFRFLLLENAFRYATEPATRNPDMPYFRGYIDSLAALHGWSDGDPFYVNYVGHPMQGAVSGYLWTLNDTRYKRVEFGRDPEYWKSRLRAGAFAWAYSEMTEIGPLMSEAAIGNIQAFYPQQGFVDHVVTPSIGLGWMIAEDVMDRYLVRFVERKVQNRYVRILVRGGANPSRSLANVISGQWPWARARDQGGDTIAVRPDTPSPRAQDPERQPGVAPFEFAANAYVFAARGGTCAGGGATAAFRINAEWQIVLDVNGCKMTGIEKNVTGDSLTYMVGPRWTPPVSGRLVPYTQVLFGGNKLTQESIFPHKEADFEELAKSTPSAPSSQYTQQFERDGFAMAAGVGLDLHFNRALAFRLIGLEYTRSWTNNLSDFASPHGFQIKTGVVLHMGTW